MELVHTFQSVPVCFQSVPVRPSSQAGLLAGSEHSGIGGLPHVAGVKRGNVGYRIYTAQGILERITGGQGMGHDLHVAWYGRCRKGDISGC